MPYYLYLRLRNINAMLNFDGDIDVDADIKYEQSISASIFSSSGKSVIPDHLVSLFIPIPFLPFSVRRAACNGWSFLQQNKHIHVRVHVGSVFTHFFNKICNFLKFPQNTKQ